MSRFALLAVVSVVAACATQQAPSRATTAECVSGCVVAPKPAVAAPSAPSELAVQQLPVEIYAVVSASADSTSAYVAEVAQNADNAALQAAFAIQPNVSLADAKPMIKVARTAAQNATSSADNVIKQGDKLNTFVNALPSAANRPWNQGANYTKYWNLARHEFVVARNNAGKAVDASDVALDCTTITCARQSIALVQSNSTSSAGASRQAEPLLRVALVYATSMFATGL
jgi:hypothetical protein